MSILKRVKKLEEQFGRKEKNLIIGIRRFSEGPWNLPSVEEQIARQRKEGKKIIVVQFANERS
jgi:protoheme ferro-lyase